MERHSFRIILGDSPETKEKLVPFHKIFTPGNKVKLRYFTQWMFHWVIKTPLLMFLKFAGFCSGGLYLASALCTHNNNVFAFLKFPESMLQNSTKTPRVLHAKNDVETPLRFQEEHTLCVGKKRYENN